MTESFYSPLALAIMKQKYLWNNESWEQLAERVAGNILWSIGIDHKHPIMKELTRLISERKFLPAGRYLAAAGKSFHMTQNCMCLKAEDSREGWSDLLKKSSMALMCGAGIGVDYSEVRCRGSLIKKTGGTASGPVALMQMLNEAGRHIQQGGDRRAALLATLIWSHPDIHEFIQIKNWSYDINRMKEKDFDFPAPLDRTNISVRLDDSFVKSYLDGDNHAISVYNMVISQMCVTGEPGFSINLGEDSSWFYGNACNEFRSDEPDNVCNLGSINMARVDDFAEFCKIVELGSIFLYAGTFYSDVPYKEVAQVRNRKRQIGLGLMGVHEWLLKRGFKYGDEPEELKKWLSVYAKNIEAVVPLAEKLGATAPQKGRAIAPTGTIGIIGETTTGCEPIFCVAYKRRYLKGESWHYQYVIDPVAKRLIESGMSEQEVEDAYSIPIEKRISFQAFLQDYVDMAISSTINMPKWGSDFNNSATVDIFGKVLMKYIPRLRGITVYPDGSRTGQPLVPVRYMTALKQAGTEFVEGAVDVCDITKGGSCGS